MFKKDEKISLKEIFCLGALIVVFLILLYPILFARQRMFAHDTIWYYGLMRYYYNALLNNVFPYWDPYDYCGQPFYYNLGIARIFEFPSIAVVFVNAIIKGSLLSMYHWDFISRIIIIALGVYFCFRQINRYMLSDIIVFTSFLFSSFAFSSMRQCGLLTSFMWTSWVFYFLIRLRKEFTLYNMVGLALFTGWSITSYQAGYTLTFIQLFIIATALTDVKWLLNILRDRRKVLLVILGCIIVLLLSLQALAVFIEKDRSVPVLRYDGEVVNIAFTDLSGGRPSEYLDFLGMVFPSRATRPDLANRIKYPVSEGYLYIGIVPFILSLFGFICSHDRFRRTFILMLIFVVFLMLGTHLVMDKAGKICFPFLIYARHMQLFQPFFLLIVMYFLGQGMDLLIDWYKRNAE